MKPFWKRVIFVLATVVTLIALFYTVENWRGKRAWRAYERELKSRQVVLDFRAVLPPHIPADSNFAATPFFAELFKGKPSATNSDSRWPTVFEEAERKLTLPTRKQRELTDLIAWQAAFRTAARAAVPTNTTRSQAAQEILEATKVYGPVLEELRVASARPASRYLVNYEVEIPWSILLPHLLVVKRTCHLLALRTSAELAIGSTEAAFQDLRLHLRLAESLESEPFLVSQLVRMAAFHMAMQNVWEGIVLQRWSDAQLAQIQARVANLNFVADLRKGFNAERSAAVLFVDLIRKQQHKRKFLDAIGLDTGATWFVGLVPAGWFDLERRNYVETFQSYFLPPLDVTNRVIKATLAKSNQRTIEEQVKKPFQRFVGHRMLVRLLLPALENVQSKTALAQAVAHEAIIACALERHRLAKGHHPAELEALTPEFLTQVPPDPVNGGPMRYKDGRIYSIGWDEKDDGGAPVKENGRIWDISALSFTGSGRALLALEGDWAWAVSTNRF